jgi:alkylated DNA repair dioxygenase AlkB
MKICNDFDLVENFYTGEESWEIYRYLLEMHDWPDNRYCFAGRQFVLPRLQTWHADTGICYSYSRNLLETRAWTPLLIEIKSKIEAFLSFSFNSVLLNHYRDGMDHVGWHADNEIELGEQPFIASLSFGATRNFEFKHKISAIHDKIFLRHGALLTMNSDFQHHWLHRIPIDQNIKQARFNLTFRNVVTSPKSEF